MLPNEDYKRIIARINEVTPDCDAVVLTVQRDGEVTVATAGHPLPLTRLKTWMYKWLGGVQ